MEEHIFRIRNFKIYEWEKNWVEIYEIFKVLKISKTKRRIQNLKIKSELKFDSKFFLSKINFLNF
jgi:hypothetical protein